MELSVADRLILINVLPAQGSITTLQIVRDLVEQVSFTEDEHAVLNFVEDAEAGQVKWTDAPLDKTTFLFGKKASSVIRAAFSELSAKNKLTMEMLPLAERILSDDVED